MQSKQLFWKKKNVLPTKIRQCGFFFVFLLCMYFLCVFGIRFNCGDRLYGLLLCGYEKVCAVISRHRLSSGIGLTMLIGSFETGCMNSTLRASSDMLPSGLLRRAPYFKSPLIGHPIFANWQRI